MPVKMVKKIIRPFTRDPRGCGGISVPQQSAESSIHISPGAKLPGFSASGRTDRRFVNKPWNDNLHREEHKALSSRCWYAVLAGQHDSRCPASVDIIIPSAPRSPALKPSVRSRTAITSIFATIHNPCFQALEPKPGRCGSQPHSQTAHRSVIAGGCSVLFTFWVTHPPLVQLVRPISQ